jgi:hypothetical protein
MLAQVSAFQRGETIVKLLIGLAFGAGLMLASAVPSLAVVAPPSAPHAHASGIMEVRDGCGRGWYRNRWGRCRPDRDWDREDWRWRHRHHHDGRDDEGDWGGRGHHGH